MFWTNILPVLLLSLLLWPSRSTPLPATVPSCTTTHHLPSINHPTTTSLPVSWHPHSLCLTIKQQPFPLLTVLNFEPTECVKFPELSWEYEQYGEGYQLFRLKYWRDPACVGVKGNHTEQVPAVFAVRKGIRIGGQVVAEVIYHVYLPLLGVAVLLAACVLFPWLRTSQLFRHDPDKSS